MKQVTVLFFATLKEKAGVSRTLQELPDHARVEDLKLQLSEKFPELAPSMFSVLVSVNREFAFDEDLLPDKAEIALFPPVSGGNSDVFPTIFAITEEEIDLNELIKRITLPSTGAVCFFTGVVRGVTTRVASHQTLFLEYEAYRPMAEDKMRQVAEEIRGRWPAVEGIAIVQRIGHLDPGKPTVLIACTAGHRDTGIFEATHYGIDRLKEIVPVWKKEVGSDGEMWVEGEYFPTRHD